MKWLTDFQLKENQRLDDRNIPSVDRGGNILTLSQRYDLYANGVEGVTSPNTGSNGWEKCLTTSNGCPPTTEGGRKDDTGKVRMDLLPPELLYAVATILSFGAKKYSARNWEQGMSWGRVFGALMRHMWAWWKRDDKDEETGYSHLWHAACCIAFLIAYEERKIGTDDRARSKI